jgi:hypothetical protein
MEQTQQQNKPYIEIENNLRYLLNHKIKNKAEMVLNCLKDFESLGFKISKEYLKNLYEKSNKNNIRSNLSYLLKDINHLITTENKYKRDFVFKKFESFAQGFNYNQKFKIGLFYSTLTKKGFNFIIINPAEIKQIQQDKQDLLLRNLSLYPEFSLKYIFSL